MGKHEVSPDGKSLGKIEDLIVDMEGGHNWPFQPPLERASRLRGKNVKDANGKPAGEIEDLVVDLRTGKVRSVIFAQNGRKGDEPKQSLPLAMFSKRGDDVTLRRRVQ